MALCLAFDLDVAGDTLQDVSEDFENIFTLLPPFESTYLSPSGPLVKAPDRVLSFYKSFGLSLSEDFGLPGDHLGLELLFMSYLVGRGDIEAQTLFLETHILPWAPPYLEAVSESAESHLYSAVATLARNFVVSDHKGILE